jgi:phosphatidylglycerophosphate synthase
MMVIASMWIRQLCDTLDGAVARKCKTTSKLGGFLDSIADHIFMFSLIFVLLTFLFKKDYIKVFAFTAVFIGSFMIINLLMFNWAFLHDHNHIKEYSGSLYKNSVAFVANNSLLVTLVLTIIYLYLTRY